MSEIGSDELTAQSMALADDLLELLERRTEHLSDRDASAVQQTAACSAFVECVADRLRLEHRPLTLGGMLECILAAPWGPVVLGVLCKLEPGRTFAPDSGETLRSLCAHRGADDAVPGGIVKLQVFGGGAPKGLQMVLCIDCVRLATASLKDLMRRSLGGAPPPSGVH